MESNPTIINNKEKQFAAGNWGSNKFVKRHTKIANPLIPESVKGGYSKRKKHVKKLYVLPWLICPFCGKELEKLAKDKDFVFNCYAKECKHCGAKETTECPACKRKTWLNKQGIYKHKYWGCGFTGKRNKLVNLP